MASFRRHHTPGGYLSLEYCIDVLQQLSAVKAALDKVALGMLDEHVRHCMTAGAGDEDRMEPMTGELMVAVSRLLVRS